MAPEQPDEQMQRLWRGQYAEGGPMPIEEIRKRAAALHRRMRMRNVLEYGAGIYVIGFSIRGALQAGDPASATGLTLLAAGALFVIWHMHRHGWAKGEPGGDDASRSADFYRAELMRQRDLLRNVWRWYLLPLAPGFLVLLAARATQNPLEVTVSAVGAILVAAVVAWMNQRAARQLQRDLDAVPH